MNPAPADARPHAPWPLWKKGLAYATLALLASVAIWYVDLKAHKGMVGDVLPAEAGSPAGRE